MLGPAGVTQVPLFLPYAGSKYLYLPGIALNYASAPDAAAVSITGNIDLRCDIAPVDWTPATQHSLISKDDGSTGVSYLFTLDTDGKLSFTYSVLGTVTVTKTSTVATGFTDGTRNSVRVTRDTSTGDVKFYTSSSVVGTWAQLGTTVAGVGSAIYDSTTVVEFGTSAVGTTLPFLGNYYRAQLCASTDGTSVALDVSFETDVYDSARATLVASTGQTITINRKATGVKSCVVNRSMFLIGSNDYFEVANVNAPDFAFTLSESFTFVLVMAIYGTPIAGSGLVKRVAGGAGIALSTGAGTGLGFTVNSTGATTITATSTFSPGVFTLGSGKRDVASDLVYAQLDGVAETGAVDATTGTLTTAIAMRLGANGAATPTLFIDAEVIGAAVFRRALSNDELVALRKEFGL